MEELNPRLCSQYVSVWQNFEGYALGNPCQFRIEGVIKYHYGAMLEPFSKLRGKGLAIKVEY